MAIYKSTSLGTWTVVALFTACAVTGCASGTGDESGDESSDLSGGGGVSPKAPLGKKGGSLGKGGGGKSGIIGLGAKGGKGGGGKGGALGGKGGGKGGGGKGGGGKGGGGKGGGGKGGGGKGGGGMGSGSSGMGSGSGSGSGSGYALATPRTGERHHDVDLAAGESESFFFTWNDVPGLAPPADLAIETGERTLVQVSGVSDAPFARAGLEVVPLRAGAPYHVLLEREGGELTVSILGEDDELLLQAHEHAETETCTASIVLPSEEFRDAVVCETDAEE